MDFVGVASQSLQRIVMDAYFITGNPMVVFLMFLGILYLFSIGMSAVGLIFRFFIFGFAYIHGLLDFVEKQIKVRMSD